MPRTHASLPRLFVEPDLVKGAAITLDPDQRSRLVNVLRLKQGDHLVAFNGRDGAWLSALGLAGRRQAELIAIEPIAPQSSPSDLWLFFAPVKSARLDYMVQKATEMGAAHIQPVITRRTVAGRVNLARMRANVIAASEQCEVLAVPEVHDPVRLDHLIETWADTHPGRRLVFADEGEGSGSTLRPLKSIAGDPVGLLIGPEGGFSDAERALLRAQRFVVAISLGPRILRADTAAVAALAAIQASIGDWR